MNGHGPALSRLPEVINFKFPLQPHQKYYITQYEECDFSKLTQMNDDHTTNSHYLILYISLQKVGRMHFLNFEVKELRRFHQPNVKNDQWVKIGQDVDDLLLLTLLFLMIVLKWFVVHDMKYENGTTINRSRQMSNKEYISTRVLLITLHRSWMPQPMSPLQLTKECRPTIRIE